MQRVRKDDRVRVVSGKHRGKEGRVVRVFPDRDRVMVEGVNYIKRHERLRQTARGSQEGGIIETEAPIHMSNVMPVCPGCNGAVRVGFELMEPGDRRSKMRRCRSCGHNF